MSAADLSKATGVPEDVIALKFGVRHKAVAGPEDTTAVMGIKAARLALTDAGMEAAEVDLVIWCGAQHKDYPCWLAGLRVAVARHSTGWRLHIERPWAPALWRWLEAGVNTIGAGAKPDNESTKDNEHG